MPPIDRLSETAVGKRWLNNFDEPDRKSAKLLLDSLYFVDESSYISDLKNLLETKFLENPELSNKRVCFLPIQPIHRDPPKPWDGTVCENQGFLTQLPPPTGSALSISSLLKKLEKKLHIKLYMSIKEMRDSKCNHLILVTDTLASGAEVDKYLSYIISNKTLKSWISFGYISISVAAVSATTEAVRLIHTKYPKVEVYYCREAQTFGTANWSYRELQSVRSLCTRYSNNPKFSLGWQEIELLEVYQHTAGNGLPNIIFRPSQKERSWNPLFDVPKLGFMDSVAEIASQQSERLRIEYHTYARQITDKNPEDPDTVHSINILRRHQKIALKILTALTVGQLGLREISRAIRCPIQITKETLKALNHLGHTAYSQRQPTHSSETDSDIDEKGLISITNRGRIQLERIQEAPRYIQNVRWQIARTRLRSSYTGLQTTSWNYYPRSLEGGEN